MADDRPDSVSENDVARSSGGRRSPQRADRSDASRVPVTDELVHKVADRVYEMLKRDAAMERERAGFKPQHW